MENNTKRNIDPQKIKAEKLNGRFALLGVIALVGAYVTTGQIIPGIVWLTASLQILINLLNLKVMHLIS